MDNIISFQRKARELGKSLCEHIHITIDDNLICECSDCGEQINPAKWILNQAKKESSVVTNIKLRDSKR